MLMFLFRGNHIAAGQAYLILVFCGTGSGNMLCFVLLFPTFGTFMPVAVVILGPDGGKGVFNRSGCITDIAPGITGTVIGMGGQLRNILHTNHTAAGAGIRSDAVFLAGRLSCNRSASPAVTA